MTARFYGSIVRQTVRKRSDVEGGDGGGDGGGSGGAGRRGVGGGSGELLGSGAEEGDVL